MTPAILRLISLADACADDLEAELRGRHVGDHPVTLRALDRDLEVVRDLRAAIAEVRSVRGDLEALDPGRTRDGLPSPFPNGHLRQIARQALEGLPEGPWVYRLDPFDDWGEVRDARGQMVARASLRATQDELSEHRRNGTDPAEKIGTFIAACRTLVPGLIAEIDRLAGEEAAG